MLLRRVIGTVLRRTRRRQGRTLRDVAQAARISVPYLSEVERGRKEVSSEILAALCRALDLPLEDLLEEVRQEVVPPKPLPATRPQPQLAPLRERAAVPQLAPLRPAPAQPQLAPLRPAPAQPQLAPLRPAPAQPQLAPLRPAPAQPEPAPLRSPTPVPQSALTPTAAHDREYPLDSEYPHAFPGDDVVMLAS